MIQKRKGRAQKEKERFKQKIETFMKYIRDNGYYNLEEFIKPLTEYFNANNIKNFIWLMQECFKENYFKHNDFAKIANFKDLNIITNYYCLKYQNKFLNVYQSLLSQKRFIIGNLADSLFEDAKMKFNNLINNRIKVTNNILVLNNDINSDDIYFDDINASDINASNINCFNFNDTNYNSDEITFFF